MAVSLRRRVCTQYRRPMNVSLAVAIDTRVIARTSARCVENETHLTTRLDNAYVEAVAMRCARS